MAPSHHHGRGSNHPRLSSGGLQNPLAYAKDMRLALIVLWAVLLYWGERYVFNRAVRSCAWETWEDWPADATPHHMTLIADPQLVDPHTYPGRPWPLSYFTIKYTDRYIRHAYQLIEQQLGPDSLFFLGDLFDGGREWSPWGLEGDDSIDARWRKYGHKYWLKEYRRFADIFFTPWLSGSKQTRSRPRKIVAGLPGNHDLGLGHGIREPVRRRFHTFFGEGNRLDMVGNHSIVSIDTVSLSAKDQPDPGPSSVSKWPEGDASHIWADTEEFLHRLSASKARAVRRHLYQMYGDLAVDALPNRHEHVVTLANETRIELSSLGLRSDQGVAAAAAATLPSILLTHVPLYRDPGTPCGPLREHYPPSKTDSGDYLEKDEPNSLKLQAGEQYQNVLTAAVSKELIDLVGDVSYVFSGDDHDYCEIVHREFTAPAAGGGGGVREITVKSISWAMGIARPGFLLVSLWNPIDAKGHSIPHPSGSSSRPGTVQTHLCLLPDQLLIFIRYGYMLALTLLVLALYAYNQVLLLQAGDPSARGRLGFGFRNGSSGQNHILPLVNGRDYKKRSIDGNMSHEMVSTYTDRTAASTTSDHSSSLHNGIHSGHSSLSSRSVTAAAHTLHNKADSPFLTRTPSPNNPGGGNSYGYTASPPAAATAAASDRAWQSVDLFDGGSHPRKGDGIKSWKTTFGLGTPNIFSLLAFSAMARRLWARELYYDVLFVGVPVVAWYGWLIMTV